MKSKEDQTREILNWKPPNQRGETSQLEDAKNTIESFLELRHLLGDPILDYRGKDFKELAGEIVESLNFNESDREEKAKVLSDLLKKEYRTVDNLQEICMDTPESVMVEIAEALSDESMGKRPEEMSPKQYRRWREAGGGK